LKKKILNKINHLNPEELIAVNELGFSDLIMKFSDVSWYKISIELLSNLDKEKYSEKVVELKKIEDLLNLVKFLEHFNSVPSSNLIFIKNILFEKIFSIEDLFNVAMELKVIPKINISKILNNSLKSNPISLVFKLTKTLDQSFGTNLRKYLFTEINRELSNNLLSKMKFEGDYKLLELTCKYAINSSSWRSTYQKILSLDIEKAKKAFRSHEEFKILTNILLKSINSCENILCSQKISDSLNQLICCTVESCIVPTELKDVIDFLKDLRLNLNKEKIKEVGKEIGMSDDEIAELID
jgi:hypothetical protein